MANRAIAAVQRLDHLTYRGNSKNTRYGWLRLTPAFSIHLILDLIRSLPDGATVLDPFCGTGTTALVCAEEGVNCETTDINPFLLWLAAAKTSHYSSEEIESARSAANGIAVDIRRRKHGGIYWRPPLFQIEKWWDDSILEQLGKIKSTVDEQEGEIGLKPTSLLKVSFCRTIIELAKVSFGHQSMSFKKPSNQLTLAIPQDAADMVVSNWQESTKSIFEAARTQIATSPNCTACDARSLTEVLQYNSFDCVITSPPYPNRMSYIRELRPYMYWLGYLEDAREAGELDWKAIGGTWGCATSNLNKWEPLGAKVPFPGFESILSRISKSSGLLSRYVHKYFCDMAIHTNELFKVVKPGGEIHYIVGNSKFYDVVLPVEAIFASMFEHAGFKDAGFKVIRKRTSKKELFEFDVTARKPG